MNRHEKTAEQREFYAEDRWMESWDEDKLEDYTIRQTAELMKTLAVIAFGIAVLFGIL